MTYAIIEADGKEFRVRFHHRRFNDTYWKQVDSNGKDIPFKKGGGLIFHSGSLPIPHGLSHVLDSENEANKSYPRCRTFYSNTILKSL